MSDEPIKTATAGGRRATFTGEYSDARIFPQATGQAKTASLSDWIEAEKKRIDEFGMWWRENHRLDPDPFPFEMPLGEWDDQYRSWGGA
jgi:hypothetical protein